LASLTIGRLAIGGHSARWRGEQVRRDAPATETPDQDTEDSVRSGQERDSLGLAPQLDDLPVHPEDPFLAERVTGYYVSDNSGFLVLKELVVDFLVAKGITGPVFGGFLWRSHLGILSSLWGSVTIDKVFLIADALGVPVAELFNGLSG
jgi:hypothetical protein